MRLVELFQIPNDVQTKVGEFLLLFSHVEWMIAQVVFLSKMTPEEHTQLKDLTIAQDLLDVILALNYSKKAEALSKTGFDCSRLNEASNYRNTLSHGIVFKNQDNFTVKKVTRLKGAGFSLDSDEVSRHIDILMEEGGKLIDFMESKGYKYHAPS